MTDINTEITVTCLIERPNGTTYTQDVVAKSEKDEDVDNAVKKLQKMLGKSYYICDYWF